MTNYKRALFALAAAQKVRLREMPEDILALTAPAEHDSAVWVKFHLPTGHWTAFPSKHRGHGLYSVARQLGLSLKDLAETFGATH
jgi:hypothetical protein